MEVLIITCLSLHGMLQVYVHLERHVSGKLDITGRTRNRFFQNFFLSDVCNFIVRNIAKIDVIYLLFLSLLALWFLCFTCVILTNWGLRLRRVDLS